MKKNGKAREIFLKWVGPGTTTPRRVPSPLQPANTVEAGLHCAPLPSLGAGIVNPGNGPWQGQVMVNIDLFTLKKVHFCLDLETALHYDPS